MEPSMDHLTEIARRLLRKGGRTILGITGPPGAGKSTIAAAIVDAVGAEARLVGMDGFHLAHAELIRLGRFDRKGAPDTFDALGYTALLRRLRDDTEAVVYAPRFERAIEDPIAGAVAIEFHVPLVVTEGNYLLVGDGAWAEVRHLLDTCWYVDLPETIRQRRLTARHEGYGRSAGEALGRTLGSDQVNTEVVEATRHRADLVITSGAG
ncbi:MAG: nucleoside/nucleotide kinase family protein [Jiangellaceae bacterium]